MVKNWQRVLSREIFVPCTFLVYFCMFLKRFEFLNSKYKIKKSNKLLSSVDLSNVDLCQLEIWGLELLRVSLGLFAMHTDVFCVCLYSTKVRSKPWFLGLCLVYYANVYCRLFSFLCRFADERFWSQCTTGRPHTKFKTKHAFGTVIKYIIKIKCNNINYKK